VDADVDADTIAAARRGDRDARGRLLHRLQDPWCRMCLSLLPVPDLARDATQETAVRFLRQLAGFRGESQLRTWSLGIALNVVREFKRQRARTRTGVDPDGRTTIERAAGEPGDRQPMPLADAERSEERDRLRSVLADLPDRQREAIVLRFLEELSVEQTAATMGCAEGTVKATVHQALRSLRQRLKQLI